MNILKIGFQFARRIRHKQQIATQHIVGCLVDDTGYVRLNDHYVFGWISTEAVHMGNGGIIEAPIDIVARVKG